MAPQPKRRKTLQPPPRRTISSSTEEEDVSSPVRLRSMTVPVAVAQPSGSGIRIQQAKKFAVAQAQHDGCTAARHPNRRTSHVPVVGITGRRTRSSRWQPSSQFQLLPFYAMRRPSHEVDVNILPSRLDKVSVMAPRKHRYNIEIRSEDPQVDEKESVGKDLSCDVPNGLGGRSIVRNTRGRTRLSKVWNLPQGQKMSVQFNDLNQPIKDNAKTFTGFLGTIAKNYRLLPINYDSWKKMPTIYKNKAWKIVKTKFEVDESHRKTTLSTINKDWKDNKSKLRVEYVTKYPSEEECLRHKPDAIPSDQWNGIVHFWFSPEGMRRSETNTIVRGKQKMSHSCGRKSLARKKDEMTEQLGREPSRAELFIEAHKRKDGSFVDPESAAIAGKLQEVITQLPNGCHDEISVKDAFSQVMGPEHPGRVRGLGLGPNPTEVFTQSTTRFTEGTSHTSIPIEEYERVKARVEELESQCAKVSELETQCAKVPQLEAQLASVLSFMKAIQEQNCLFTPLRGGDNDSDDEASSSL